MSSEESNTPTKNENLQDLSPTFNFALNHRILPLCAVSAKVVPEEKETLIAVTVSNKVILKGELLKHSRL
uniref:Uncharacterized protein n=1 Tax=Heterorhabditis bacteriophora TaxID=37862 RepID=A0A1I7XUJ9_HETBA